MESANSIDKKLLYSSCYGDLEGVVGALVQGGRVSVRNSQGFTPLLAAAQNGHTDICGLLLAHGCDANALLNPKHTSLHFAADRGHEAVVEALLSWGGAIVDSHDRQGYTPLLMAIQGGHVACVLTLLKAGASLFVGDMFGTLPIHKAAERNRVEIVRILLDYGCSVDMVSCSENTFLDALASLESILIISHHSQESIG